MRSSATSSFHSSYAAEQRVSVRHTIIPVTLHSHREDASDECTLAPQRRAPPRRANRRQLAVYAIMVGFPP